MRGPSLALSGLLLLAPWAHAQSQALRDCHRLRAECGEVEQPGGAKLDCGRCAAPLECSTERRCRAPGHKGHYGPATPGKGWTVRSPVPPFPNLPGLKVLTVWAAAKDDVWVSAADSPGRLYHLVDGAWQPVDAPAQAPLSALWGLSPKDVWAGGASGAVVRWNGRAWSAVQVPTRLTVTAFAGTSPTDVWALGGEQTGVRDTREGEEPVYSPLALHFDGKAWAKAMPGKDSGAEVLRAPWMASPTALWVMAPRCHFWSGAWRDCQGELDGIAAGRPARVSAFAGTGPGDVWQLGEAEAGHFDGKEWASYKLPRACSPSSCGSVEVARAVSPLDAWLIAPPTQDRRRTQLLRWHDLQWTSTLDRSGEVTSLSATSADDAWAAGPDGLLHWNGRRWVKEPPRFVTVQAAADNDVWALTKEGDAFRWDGAAWAAAELPVNVSPSAAWRVAPDDVWLLGAGAARWNGRAWAIRAERPGVRAVWGFGPSDAWAVGSSVLHWDGREWRSHEKPAGHTLEAVWGAAPDDVWVTGYGGRLVHWDGKAWTVHLPNSSPDRELYALFGTSRDDVWAAGNKGALWHWDGKSWSRAESPTKQDLRGLCGGGGRVYAVGPGAAGEGGVALTLSDGRWQLAERPPVSLWSCAVTPSGKVWAGGEGVVLVSGPLEAVPP